MEFLSYNPLEILSVSNILYIILGSIVGMMIGAMPGLGAPVGCALLIPLTFTMPAESAILMLISLYMAAQYGGSISSVVLGIPGTPAAVATVWDGTPIARRGQPGLALGYTLYASTVGGIFGFLVLVMLTGPLSKFAINMSDPELFLVGLLGLVSTFSLDSKNPVRAVISVLLGLFLGTVGLDVFTGAHRFTFGNIYLGDGISMVPVFAGMFALTEVFEMVSGDLSMRYVTDVKNVRCKVPFKEFIKHIKAILKASVIGTIFGIVPGLGAGPATMFTYAHAKRSAPDPEMVGNGSPHMLTSVEACNNAVVGGGLVPLLSLGIPGTPTVAIVASALIMHGIHPGPNLLTHSPGLVYTVYWGLLFATICMFIFGKFTTSVFARLLICPNYILAAIVIIFSLVGSYAARYYPIDVWIAIIAALVVYVLRKLDFSVGAFTLAFVLASMIEEHFRRSLKLSLGSPMIFFNRPLCIVLWALIILLIVISIRSAKNTKSEKANADKANETK